MHGAPPEALQTDVQPAMTARLSPSEVEHLFPVEWTDVDPLAAAEPSKAALLRLDTGGVVLVEYGTLTSTLTVSVPRDQDLSRTLADLLAEAPIASSAINWVVEQ